MRFMMIFFLHVVLFANSYNFIESKYISAVSASFEKEGNINIQKNRVVITYKKPSYKKIIEEDNNVSIEDSKGRVYHLKNQARHYTKLFIDIMVRLGDFDKLKSNDDFDVQKDGNIYNLTFKGDLADSIVKAEVKVKNSKVLSFKMFMPNDDTLKITKK